MRWLSLSVMGLLAGCGASKRADVEPMAAWRTPAGARSVKLDLVASFLDRGAVEQALSLLSQMREQHGTNDAEVNLLQGRALRMSGMTAEAERLEVLARARMPRDPRPQRELGVIYADSGRPQLAIQALERATKLDDSHAPSWNNLGFLYLGAGRTEDAVKALEQAIALDGSQSRFRNNLGFALLSQGKEGRALQLFRSSGTEADAQYNLGVGYARLGESMLARNAYAKALRVDPTYPHAKAALDLSTPLEDP